MQHRPENMPWFSMSSTTRQLVFAALAAVFVWAIIPGAAKAAGFSLSFDGANDYVDVPDDASLDLTVDATAELWFKKSSSSGGWIGLVEKSGFNDAQQPWALYLNDTGGANQVGFYMGDGTTFDGVDSATGAYANDGQWHHIAVTWDRVGATEVVRMYVDGTELSYVGDNVIDGITLGYTNTESVIFGAAYTAPNQWQADRWFWHDGEMDEVRLYSRVLSPAEIQDHADTNYSDDTGLVGLWHLDEGSGTSAVDSSGTGNNGTVFGPTWVDGIVILGPPPAGGYSYFPEVEIITSPTEGDVFAGGATITYKAGDANDELGPVQFGLGNDAVSLYYSDDDGATWILLVEGQPPDGTYVWDDAKIQEGVTYRIKVVVVDRTGKLGDKVSGSFRVDRTAPTYTVVVEPPLTKGETVHITVQASEALGAAPLVTVYQRNAVPAPLTVVGEGALWEVDYPITPGFDGTARVTVEGADLAGNTGTLITQGGFFNVGINPPPKPIVLSPLDNDIVDSSLVTVTGRIREDTKAVLWLNAERFGEAAPDSAGDFVFANVALSKTFNKGVNILQVLSEDVIGVSSEPVTLTVKFNAAPTLSIVSPTEGEVLQGTATLKVSAADENADTLLFTFEVSANGGASWQTIASNVEDTLYRWSTTVFPDGENYRLRVTVDDGFKQIAATSGIFKVLNFLPEITFDVEGRIVTNLIAVTISGTAAAPIRPGRGRQIDAVDYSLDRGATWTTATASDGAFGGESEAFTVVLTNLSDGSYAVLVRAVDERGFAGRAQKTVIVDLGPPRAPTVRSPEAGAVFGDSEDLDLGKAGVQLLVTGNAEANNIIEAVVDEVIFTGASDRRGRFSFEVTLRDHGENLLVVIAIDPAGNRSEEAATLIIVNNNPPDARFLRPKEGGAIGQVYDIVFEIQDRELDPIRETTLSYRRRGAEEAIVLARDMADNTFSWDVRGLREGVYELILTASDGISEKTVTREIAVDNTPPTLSFEALEKNTFTQSFTLEMEGSARDDLSGVAFVEYRIDEGEWFKALITSGYESRRATFRLRHPFALEDGTYEVRFRATDVARNVSEVSEAQEIRIDTIAPRIGSYTLSFGSLTLLPEGEFFTVIVGGRAALIISLEADVERATLSVGGEERELERRGALWGTDIVISEVGDAVMRITAVDAFGNETRDKPIGALRVVRERSVSSSDGGAVQDVKVAVLLLDRSSGTWNEWQAEPYGLANPVFTDAEGRYSFLLPEGTYQLLLTKRGFQRSRSSRFTVTSPRFVSFDFTLEVRRGFRGFIENLLERFFFR